MRVILDTNVLISGILSSESRPGQLLRHWRNGRFVLITCEEQIAEIRRVSRYTKMRGRLFPAEIGSLVNRLREQAVFVDKLAQVDLSPDPWDNFLLALAEAGQADVLLTGDKRDVLALKRHGRTEILSVRAFLDRL